MDVGIGLPNTVPGTQREQLLEFAQRGEQRGFASLNTLDRLVYPGLEPLVTLAAAGAVTSRIPLRSAAVLAPYRLNGALLAKEAASVHVLTGGRFELGLGLGWREDDYVASGIRFTERGRRMDEMLAEIERAWSGHDYGFAGGIGPDVASDPPKLLLGGTVDASFRRAARYGDGWILGGGTPEQFVDCKRRLEEAWQEAGREGQPVAMSLAYFSLGDRAQEDADSYLGHYYSAGGEDFAKMVIGSAAKDSETVRSYVQAFTEAGCDELFLFPCSADPEQADLLAEAALGARTS
jgi:alkanesulfonate monooxygenase SsuD/methylene tetrahydromethanopterin reductase-like flavin-dependent oxidoreductase (luciferase family)